MKRKAPAVFPGLNQTEMAAFLGVNRVRVEWATHEKIIERGADGLYHPEIVTPLWLEYVQSPRARSGAHPNEFEQERARLYRVKADAAERRLATIDRSLVSTSDIIELTKVVCMRIRNKMTSAIPRIARNVYAAATPKEAALAVRREVDVLLSELAALKPDRRRGQLEVVRANGESES